MLIKDNEVFIFKSDPSYPYVRVGTGYFDPITEEFADCEWTDGTSSFENDLLRVDRSLLWRNAATEGIPSYIVEERILKIAAQSQAIRSRTTHFFTCARCKKTERQTVILERAKQQICKKCRFTDTRTIQMFEELAI